MSRRQALAALLGQPLGTMNAVTRPAAEVNASYYGADGSGRVDVTAALAAAAQAIPPGGGRLLLRPGTYPVSSSVLLGSQTEVVGFGATLVASGDWRRRDGAGNPSAGGYSAIANRGFRSAGPAERDITLRGLTFDYTALPLGEAHAVSFRQASGIRILDCRFTGGGNGTALLACRDTLVARCVSRGTLNCAYDHWEGTSRAVVADCFAACARNYGILFTGVGTDAQDHRRATDVKAVNNRIFTPTQAGIWVCSDSAASSVARAQILDNYVYCGTPADGIGATGDVSDVVISGNTVKAVRGGNAIFIRPDRWNRPHGAAIIGNRLLDCTTQGDNVALIEALGDAAVIRGNRATGGTYPSLVWVNGAECALADNQGDAVTSGQKYRINPARHPVVEDP